MGELESGGEAGGQRVTKKEGAGDGVTLYFVGRSGPRLRMTLLWLLASLAFGSFPPVTDGAPLQVMSAPNLLRVETAENIFVECQDCTGEGMRVEIKVTSHPTKSRILASTSVTLTSDNHFQAFGEIKIHAGDFSPDPDMKQYVYLQAQFPGRLLEKVVLVSFQSGYIFIQTDRNLYTPNSKVLYRIFAVTPSIRPVERSAQTDAAIAIEILTPDGVSSSTDKVLLNSGIYNGEHRLDDAVSPGVWKVVARFQNNPLQSYSAEFEVKDYEWPSFEITLIPVRPFFYDSQNFTVTIKATNTFGGKVDGYAYVTFGVIKEGEKRIFPHSLQRLGLDEGVVEATLKREHITQSFNIMDLVGSSMFVAVTVHNGAETVKAELRDIQIVTSPYIVTFKRTPKFYKPGMPFDVLVEVTNPDGTPAQGVPVVVDPGQTQGYTAANGMARLIINTVARADPLSVTARTNNPAVLPNRQATATMVAIPYISNSNSYINIGVDAAEPNLYDNLKINLVVLNKQKNTPSDITYLVLSRGQLVKHGRIKERGQMLISLLIPISKEMLPSFRIIAYYHTNDNEVVSDSVMVDVEDSCMGSLSLEPTRPAPSYEPRRMFGLKVTGDPGATVGLVAVDKGAYVLNKHRLTQKKVWDIIEKYDTGCTPGGGRDGMGVFYDAGLLFESSTASGTSYRQELRCPAPARSKRATTMIEVTTSLLSDYKDELQHDCCQEGLKETPVSYSCEIRSRDIADNQACVNAFLQCCREMENQRADHREDNLQLVRSKRQGHRTASSLPPEDEEYFSEHYLDLDEVLSRTLFIKSWLWFDITLPSCPPGNPNCNTVSSVKSFPLPDSVTTWMTVGISLSQAYGICVGEPLQIVVRQEFLIDLRLPYSAVKGEQIEVKAILHNYSPDLAIVRVDLIKEEHVCSAASTRARFRQEVTVGSQTSRLVPFVIIPMKEGEYNIEVKAAVKGSSLSDGVRKTLRVVPQGVLMKSLQYVTLDPTTEGVEGRQEVILNSRIPMKDLVPNAPTRTEISVKGRGGSALVENAISGRSMGRLIYRPAGCGEDVISHMTLPVIATTYLDKTNQWEAVGFQKRIEALKHIKYGYQKELSYRKNDGSFAIWPSQKSSTWLTAYVAKVFTMASDLIVVQRDVICDAVRFLILNAQQPDGGFREVGKVFHGEMIGDMLGNDSDASMTAFCLIAIQESRTLCSYLSLPGSVDKAVAYLENRLPNLTNPYAVAMTSYALANENRLNRDILYRFVSPELSHWPVAKGQVYTLEATAYALLALVRAKAFTVTRPIVRWFNKQLKVGGGYGSLQSTIMVYQAVAEYWVSAREQEYDLDVDILHDRLGLKRFNFNRYNINTPRSVKMNTINANITVTATGGGEAMVEMVSLYYTLPEVRESDCQKFNMSVQLLPEKMGEDQMMIYRLKIQLLYKDTDHNATKSTLDIGLLTGFTVNRKDLDTLSKGSTRTKYEMSTELSERGSLIIYLDEVSHTHPEEITFRIHQNFKVGVLQPAAVSVYEYSDLETPCVKFYHPQRKAGQLLRLCNNDECTCAEEACTMQKKGNINNAKRTAKACESTPTSIDFVYKVRLEQFTEDLSTDLYTMRVEEVIKEGPTDVGLQGTLRYFLSFQLCRESLDLRIGKAYLIMGTSQDVHTDEQKQSYQYVLGERTWVEYWPTPTECETETYQPTCFGIDELRAQYEVFGCPL